MGPILIGVVVIIVLLVAGTKDKVADWGGKRIREQADGYRKSRNGGIVVLGIIIAIAVAAADKGRSKKSADSAPKWFDSGEFEPKPRSLNLPRLAEENPSPSDELAALRKARATLEDPPTQPSEGKTMMGIGLSLGEEDGKIVATSILANSPAARTNLIRGAHVTAINGRSTQGSSSSDCADWIRNGPDNVQIEAKNPFYIKANTYELRKALITYPK